MDYFLSSDDLYGTNLLHVPADRLDPSACRTPPSCQTKQGGLRGPDLKDYLFHQDPLAAHFSRDAYPMQDILNCTSQSSASAFGPTSAQHQTSNLYISSATPLRSSYVMLSKENEFLHTAGCYSPSVSSTHHQLHPRTHSFSSTTTLLGSPFAPRPLVPSFCPSTPVKYDTSKAVERLSPTHFSDVSLVFLKDTDSPFNIRGLSSWSSSDPELSPVIRAPPVSRPLNPGQSKPKASSSSTDENRPPTSVSAVPATPKHSLCSSKRSDTSLSSRSNSFTSPRSSPTTHSLFGGYSTPTPLTCLALSPLTPLTPFISPKHVEQATRKRKLKKEPEESVLSSPSPVPRKRRRFHRLKCTGPNPSSLNPILDQAPDAKLRPYYTNRSFSDIEVSLDFPLFYRRYPLSSYLQPEDAGSPCTLFGVKHPGGNYNRPRSPFDLYTPRFVKGKGAEKVGLCPICIESHIRGGEGKALWLAMKFSALNYHMQYSHGISASSGLPFAPPVAFRTVNRPNPGKKEKAMTRQGKCHRCLKWVPIEGIKDMETKVKEIYWWKHAASCHHDSSTRDDDVYEKDFVYEKLVSLFN
ncbi:hypothetical protein AX15_007570 [Amanita polypyramis BW_CC]|nr:hypothetical protein AX15_007570 [Amanita polypyramis BW_CC]